MTVTAPSSAPEKAALRDAALTLAECGMYVFPLKPGTKVPALHQGWEERASTDPERIRTCWARGPYNIGVACGPSGLLVVDCDTPKPDTAPPPAPFNVPGVNEGADVLVMLAERYAQPFPWSTFHVTTGRGGMHLYFHQPDGEPLRNTAGRLGWLIDTRGQGGYVVGPGSIVDGKPYRGFGQPDAVPLPGWLARLLTAPKQRPAPPTRAPSGPNASPRRGGAYTAKVLREEIAKVLAARPGTRNTTVNAVAFNLGRHAARGTVPADIAQAALERAVEAIGDDVAKNLSTARHAFTDGLEKGDA